MFHYLFTNDLRISRLESALVEASYCFKNDCVPSATEDKNANNNMLTLGFYFNLTRDSYCTNECVNGNTRKVVLNFIKKFQFPNPRTETSLTDCVLDDIQLAPMRVILQTLYMMLMICPEEAYLSNFEIAKYIFFNEKIAKTSKPNIVDLVADIVDNRIGGEDASISDDEILEAKGCYWKHCKRQIREMVKVLTWSGCVTEDENGRIKIFHNNLSRDNKADIFDIITFSGFWVPDTSRSLEESKLSYQRYMDLEPSATETEEIGTESARFDNFQLNRVFFGAPGTGKSYTLNKRKDELLRAGGEYERVTFHPDYSYANFVGTYKPVPNGTSINYEFVPGPFIRTFVKAYNKPEIPFLLIIEEINRANVAAVFGDVFQLLDRKSNVSEYPVQTSEDLKKFLGKPVEEGGIGVELDELRIPSNMFIWATMNSADQGVFPMDTAFKRRWDFEYIGIDAGEEKENVKPILDSSNFVKLEKKTENGGYVWENWNVARKKINGYLTALGINEDKQMGPFFVDLDKLDTFESFDDAFKNKVLMYLFEDAAKAKRKQLFADPNTTYSKLVKDYDGGGIKAIFNKVTSD